MAGRTSCLRIWSILRFSPNKYDMRFPISQTRSVGLLAILAIAATVVSVATLIWGLRARELEHSKLETVSLTEMLMEHTRQDFDSIDLVLQGVQERLSSEFGRQFDLNSPFTHLLLATRASSVKRLKSIFLVDNRGIVVNTSLDLHVAGRSIEDRDYFQEFAHGGATTLFIEKPVRSRVDNEWTLHIARPLFGIRKEFRGVVVASLSIPEFEKILKLVKLDYVRPISLYLADGTLIASLPHRENLIGTLATELTNENLPKDDNQVHNIRHISGNGEHQLFAIGRLPKYPLLVGVSDDETLSLAYWRELTVPISLGAMLLCIFIAVVAIFLIGKLKSRETLSSALQASKDLYQHTVESVMDAIVAVNASMQIILFNPAAEKMFGLKASDLVGKPLDTLMPERHRTAHHGHVGQFSTSEAGSRVMAPQLEITGQRADGREFPVESTISKSWIGGNLQMTAVLRDVSLQRRAETQLREANTQLRAFAASLQSVREEERLRISRELHDDLGQQLTGLKLSLSWLGTRLREGRSTEPDAVDEMRVQLDKALTSVRRISTELRPLILDDLGLGEAIACHALDFGNRCGFEVNLDLKAATDIKNDAVATALFRIVQESLTNIARHAGATQVKIELVQDDHYLTLRVNDNGRGMSADTGHTGIGLISMRERSIAVGASFRLFSHLGSGTTIEVTIPHSSVLQAGTKT